MRTRTRTCRRRTPRRRRTARSEAHRRGSGPAAGSPRPSSVGTSRDRCPGGQPPGPGDRVVDLQARTRTPVQVHHREAGRVTGLRIPDLGPIRKLDSKVRPHLYSHSRPQDAHAASATKPCPPGSLRPTGTAGRTWVLPCRRTCRHGERKDELAVEHQVPGAELVERVEQHPERQVPPGQQQAEDEAHDNRKTRPKKRVGTTMVTCRTAPPSRRASAPAPEAAPMVRWAPGVRAVPCVTTCRVDRQDALRRPTRDGRRVTAHNA